MIFRKAELLVLLLGLNQQWIMMYIYNKGEIQKYVYIVIHRDTLLWWLKGLCVLSVLLSLDSR